MENFKRYLQTLTRADLLEWRDALLELANTEQERNAPYWSRRDDELKVSLIAKELSKAIPPRTARCQRSGCNDVCVLPNGPQGKVLCNYHS